MLPMRIVNRASAFNFHRAIGCASIRTLGDAERTDFEDSPRSSSTLSSKGQRSAD